MFLPAEWRRGDSMPMYVGALAKGWLHGRVESKLIRGGRNEDVVGTVEIPGGERSRATIRAPRQNWTHDELLVALKPHHKFTLGHPPRKAAGHHRAGREVGPPREQRGDEIVELCLF